MTKEQAIELAEKGLYKHLSHREIAILQLTEEKLCIPFDIFQEAVEKTLGRPVWTHEFADAERLRNELYQALLMDKHPLCSCTHEPGVAF